MIDDETLLAYVDGELEPGQREELARAIESDVSLASRVQVFVESREWTRSALAHVAAEPVPNELVNVIRNHKTPPLAAPRWWALAASLAALLVGGIVGYSVGGDSSQQPAPPSWMSAALVQVLSHERSGSVVTDAGAEIMVTMSFRARRGRLCREYRLRQSHDAMTGVACRLGTTGWNIEFVIPETTLADSISQESYEPAAGPDVPTQALVETMVEHVLSPTEEQTLLNADWRE